MKLLLINPNTTTGITDLVVREARRLAPPDVEIAGVTARFGGRYIANRATYAIAAHAALDAYAEHAEGADAVVLACFGDPALAALKEIASQPVVGMAEAACHAAAGNAGRFAIVTGGERWGPMLCEFVTSIGLSARLATVLTVAPTGGDIARDPDGALGVLAEACNTCVSQHGATSVILGGAGLAGLADRLSARVRVPLIDGLAVAVAEATALARQRVSTRHLGQAAGQGTETTGLATPLARLLAERT